VKERFMESLQEIEDKIRKIIDDVRVFLHQDGGDAEFAGTEKVRIANEDKLIVYIRLLGNCNDCSLRMMTLRGGIERYIKKEISSVHRVELDRKKKTVI
jgi:Fe-S cluster biogenesis protein NfuA